jgi:hypothetical protein
MPQQLIYTSAPRGLVAGRSGHCTVARSAGMREPLVLRLEQLSYYQHLSLAGGQERPISAYRVVDIRGSRFHVLSRIQDAGLDYSGRTNFIAHHLVVAPEELRQFPTPAVILRNWSGWLAAWGKEPRQLSNEDWGNLGSLVSTSSLPAQTWQRLSGDAVNGYGLLELKQGTCLGIDGISENEALSLLAESTELLELRDTRRNFQAAAWQYTFTTSMQEQDNPPDFRWRLAHTENPGVARMAGASCLSLCSLRASGVTAEERIFAQKGWQAPTTVEITLDRGTITEGESVRLEARADGVPFPRFRWFEIERGKPVELAGRSGPVLQEQPAGRAKRYMVQAENRAGCKDSGVAELSIDQPLRLAPREPLSVRPKAAAGWGGHRKTGEEIEADRMRWAERKGEERERRKRRWRAAFLVVALMLLMVSAVAGIRLAMRRGQKPTTSPQQASTGSTNHPPIPKTIAGSNAPKAENPLESPGAMKASANLHQLLGTADPSSRQLEPDVRTRTSHSEALSDPDEPWPDQWKETLVGEVAPGTCRKNYAGGTFFLTGCGRNIAQYSDNFYFVHRAASNSVLFTARLSQARGESPYTMCGIMIRGSEKNDAPSVFVGASSTLLYCVERPSLGRSCPMHSGPRPDAPSLYLSLERNGNNFSAAFSTNGQSWEPFWGVRVISMQSEGLLGFAICSGKSNARVTANFDKVSVNGVTQ